VYDPDGLVTADSGAVVYVVSEYAVTTTDATGFPDTASVTTPATLPVEPPARRDWSPSSRVVEELTGAATLDVAADP
jgi:hypothetical protein